MNASGPCELSSTYASALVLDLLRRGRVVVHDLVRVVDPEALRDEAQQVDQADPDAQDRRSDRARARDADAALTVHDDHVRSGIGDGVGR
jgi:hypothetical protein